MKLRCALFVALLLVPFAASAQSVKVVDPSTGLPVFSSANPAPVTITSGTSVPTGTAGTPSTSVVTVQGITNGTKLDMNEAQVAGATLSTGNGVVGTGVQRVAIASDNTAFSVNATATGNVASGTTDSGNGIKIAGVGIATQPTAVTAGQRVDAAFSLKGALHVSMGAPVGTSVGWGASVSFPEANDATQVPIAVMPAVWDAGTSSMYSLRGDVNGVAVSKGLTSTRWRYTSGTSPILSNTTTAVTIKASAGGALKNAIDSCQLTTTAFTASVPLAIRDGAGGTVMWALTVPTAGFLQPVNIVFEQPLVGTAATLMEVVTTTANTAGTVTFNCQGHTEN
jgi:hypothetical protein